MSRSCTEIRTDNRVQFGSFLYQVFCFLMVTKCYCDFQLIHNLTERNRLENFVSGAWIVRVEIESLNDDMMDSIENDTFFNFQ